MDKKPPALPRLGPTILARLVAEKQQTLIMKKKHISHSWNISLQDRTPL